jgi:porphobilinogen deaminase
MAQPVVIGTRGSKLALWQAEWVRSTLTQRFPGVAVELSIIKTQGDKIVDGGTVIKHRLSGPAASAERIGVELAEILLSRGADEILKKTHQRGTVT